MQENKSNIIVYNDGELELKVSLENETVWLNRNQIAELFGRDVKTIGKHITNVFNDGELNRIAYNGVFEQCFQKYLNTFDKNIF